MMLEEVVAAGASPGGATVTAHRNFICFQFAPRTECAAISSVKLQPTLVISESSIYNTRCAAHQSKAPRC